MGTKKAGLGRGLDAIFSENELEPSGGINKIRITLVEPTPGQPRKNFDTEALAQLADSIAANGVLQPILVRESGNGFYRIIAGERRWRASKLAGLSEIPAIIMDADELKAAEIALIENIQRENLNAYEEAEAYRALIGQYNLTQEQVASRIGKSRSAVTNSLRLLDLPDDVCDMLKRDEISAGHARALLGLKDRTAMVSLAAKAAGGKMSVRDMELAVKKANRAGNKADTDDEGGTKVDYIGDLARRATEMSGHKITISDGIRKTVHVDFADYGDLEDLLRKLCGDGIIE